MLLLSTLKNWNKIIDEAIEREDWFSGFTNSVTFVEHWAYWKLRWYCIKNKIKLKEELKRLNVGNLVTILYLLKLINEETYAKIKKSIVERNKLIHPGRKGISYRDRKEKDRATDLLNDAITCIKELKEGLVH